MKWCVCVESTFVAQDNLVTMKSGVLALTMMIELLLARSV